MIGQVEEENTKFFITGSAEETAKVGFDLAQDLKNKKEKIVVIVLLSGDLGSGKTTFTQGFARGLGINSYIKSPTFIILQNYEIEGNKNFKKFVHVDAYRLENGQELRKIGVEKILADPEKIVLIEWPENVSEILPKEVIKVSLKHLDNNKREIVIMV